MTTWGDDMGAWHYNLINLEKAWRNLPSRSCVIRCWRAEKSGPGLATTHYRSRPRLAGDVHGNVDEPLTGACVVGVGSPEGVAYARLAFLEIVDHLRTPRAAKE